MAKRKKTVFDYNQLSHEWTKQDPENTHLKAPGGRMFTTGDTIWSYGSHFAIARIHSLGKKKGKIVFMTDRKWSNTTRDHISYVKDAVRHLTKIVCPYPEEGALTKNISEWRSRLESHMSVINDSSRQQHTRDFRVVDMWGTINEIRAYLKATGEKITKPWGYSDYHRVEFLKAYRKACKITITQELRTRIDEYHSKSAERRARAQAAADAIRERRHQMWIDGDARRSAINQMTYEQLAFLWRSNGSVNGKVVETHDFYDLKRDQRYLGDENAMLRAEGQQVATSNGARVGFEAAKILLSAIRAGKDIKGMNVDGYTVIGINGVLKVGCHTITREEINRFSITQGWITEAEALPLH